MNKYYNADDVMNAINEWAVSLWFIGGESMTRGLREKINELPATDMQEIKQGRWEEEFDDITCSVCKNWFNIFDNDTQKFQYCPCCGARMDGERNA